MLRWQIKHEESSQWQLLVRARDWYEARVLGARAFGCASSRLQVEPYHGLSNPQAALGRARALIARKRARARAVKFRGRRKPPPR